jgi:hypothetical protein
MIGILLGITMLQKIVAVIVQQKIGESNERKSTSILELTQAHLEYPKLQNK